jgi:hypothetical protein
MNESHGWLLELFQLVLEVRVGTGFDFFDFYFHDPYCTGRLRLELTNDE